MFFFLILYAGSQRESVNRRRPRNNSGTKSAYAYKIYLVTSSGNMNIVYKKFFMNIFQISSGRTDRILKSHENIPKNMSGKKNYELLANTVIQPT